MGEVPVFAGGDYQRGNEDDLRGKPHFAHSTMTASFACFSSSGIASLISLMKA